MLTHKTWALAALGLVVSALINPSFAHETNHHTQGGSPAAATDQPSIETALGTRDGVESRLSSVSPIGSFISGFLETDDAGGNTCAYPSSTGRSTRSPCAAWR
jgi:hypothetical protein